MGIEPKFNKRVIAAQCREVVERRVAALVYRFGAVGEAAVNHARLGGNYKDRTGNLRSSTGWVLDIKGEGEQVGAFSEVYGPEPGERVGRERGIALCRRAAKEGKARITLAVGAGMEYAADVEARGYDVITSSARAARAKAEELVEKILVKGMKP